MVADSADISEKPVGHEKEDVEIDSCFDVETSDKVDTSIEEINMATDDVPTLADASDPQRRAPGPPVEVGTKMSFLVSISSLILLTVAVSMSVILPLTVLEGLLYLGASSTDLKAVLETMCIVTSLLMIVVPLGLVRKALAEGHVEPAAIKMVIGYSVGSLVSLVYGVRQRITAMVVTSGAGFMLQIMWLLFATLLPLAADRESDGDAKTKRFFSYLLPAYALYVVATASASVALVFLAPQRVLNVCYLVSGLIAQIGSLISLPEVIYHKRMHDSTKRPSPPSPMLSFAAALTFLKSPAAVKLAHLRSLPAGLRTHLSKEINFQTLLDVFLANNFLWLLFSYLEKDVALYWCCLLAFMTTSLQWLALHTPPLKIQNSVLADFQLLFISQPNEHITTIPLNAP